MGGQTSFLLQLRVQRKKCYILQCEKQKSLYFGRGLFGEIWLPTGKGFPRFVETISGGAGTTDKLQAPEAMSCQNNHAHGKA